MFKSKDNSIEIVFFLFVVCIGITMADEISPKTKIITGSIALFILLVYLFSMFDNKK